MSQADHRGSVATDAIVHFATTFSLDDVPQAVVGRAVDALTDTVGVLLGGALERPPRFVLRYLESVGQIPGAVGLLGLAVTATPPAAALYHGACVHALDYDDTGHPGNVHPSSHVLPALLSLAEPGTTSGRELLSAYLVGLEVENKIGMCLPSAVRNLNIHPTGVIGPLAAAMAGSQLLRFDDEQTRMALGIAGSFAAGLRANNGTDVKPLHAGRAAESGVVAVGLAQEGTNGCPAIIDARYGFLDAFYANQDNAVAPDVTPLLELGSTWEFEKDFGIALKPYPCCACSHPAIEAALRISARTGATAIETVSVKMSEYARSIVDDPSPDTYTRARFSVQYCVAAALQRHVVNRPTFSAESIEDPAVRCLMANTTVEVAPELRDDLEHPATVMVTLADGRTESEHVAFAAGKPASWLSTEALHDKFDDCVGHSLLSEEGEQLFQWLQHLPDHSSCDELHRLSIGGVRA